MSSLKKFVNKKGQSTPHLYRDVKSDLFFALIRVGKSIRKRSLETDDYVSAITKLPGTLTELGNEIAGRRINAGQKLLGDFWQDLTAIKDDEEQAAATTRRRNGVWDNHLKGFFAHLRPSDIHPNTITEFLEWHRKRNPKAQYVNIYKYLGQLFREMLRIGALEPKQVPLLTLSKKEVLHHASKKGRVAESTEHAALLCVITGSFSIRYKLAYSLGFRKMEVGNLKRDQVRSSKGRVVLAFDTDETKTGLPREVPLPIDLGQELLEWIREGAGEEFIFPTKDGLKPQPPQLIDREWKTAKKSAGIKSRLRFHDLRHTAATNMARQGINPIIACTILGMSIVTYQKKYLKLTAADLIMDVDRISGAAK